jgi:asparagine synthetase B (glutamine-hydrolysing)
LRFPEGLTDEGATQLSVAQALGMPQTLRKIGENLDGESIVQGSLALSLSSPCPVLGIWQSLYTELLSSAAEHGLQKLLMGTGGDEMLTVDLAYGTDLFQAFDLRRLWRFYRAMARTSPFSSLRVARLVLWEVAIKPEMLRWVSSGLDRVAPRVKTRLRRNRKPLTPAPWISQSDPTLTETLKRRRLTSTPVELASGEGAYVRAIRGLSQSPQLMLELEQGEAWAQDSGFTVLYPFFDRDLVDLLLRAHPEHLIAGGRAKTPLRRLVAERLPSVSLPSKKVDFTQTVHEVLRSSGQRAWQNMKGLSFLAELGIIEHDRMASLMEAYFAGRNNNWVRTWVVLSTEAWLQARSN